MEEDKGCKGRVRTSKKRDRGEIETGLQGQGGRERKRKIVKRIGGKKKDICAHLVIILVVLTYY